MENENVGIVMELSRSELKQLAKAVGGIVGWPWYNADEPAMPGDSISFTDRNGKELIIKIVHREASFHCK